jgi:lipopolysaccharide/colanic/teichoic acid biosynthesis glycosyltransferase
VPCEPGLPIARVEPLQLVGNRTRTAGQAVATLGRAQTTRARRMAPGADEARQFRLHGSAAIASLETVAPEITSLAELERAPRKRRLDPQVARRGLGAVRNDEHHRPVGALGEWLEVPLPAWKRAFDLAACAVLLPVLAPVLACAALAIRLTSPGPVIYRQQRAGRGGRPFTIYKFRSMYVDADARRKELERQNEADGPVFKIRHDPRITPVGRFLRRSSIDELPQLWNVLKGDMTLVGPRPPMMSEIEEYEPWQLGRLRVTGGITCIWQVSGRSEIGFVDWVRMDLRYAREQSFLLDMRLLFQTVGAVLSSRGAY